jgi:hypothetical protein
VIKNRRRIVMHAFVVRSGSFAWGARFG